MHDIEWQQLAEASADAFLLIAADGTIVSASSAAARMFGWSRAELLGTAAIDLLPLRLRAIHGPELTGFFVDPAATTLTHGPGLFGLRRDGSELPIEVHVSPVTTASGRRMVVWIRDTTERVRADEARRAAEEALRRSQEIAGVGTWDWDLTTDQIVTSPVLHQIYGLPPGEPGPHPRAGWGPMIHAADRERVRRLIDQAIASGGSFRFEHLLTMPDGRERQFLQQGRVEVVDGRAVRVIGTALDITEIRQAERDRARALRELEAVLEQCPIGITVARSLDGQEIVRNRVARAMVDEAPGPPALTDLDGVAVARDQLPLMRALRGEHIERAEYLLRSPTGRVIPAEATAAPVRNDAGEIEGAVIAVQDISAAKEIERLRAEWSAVVAHDLRQPLNAMRLTVELLTRDPLASPATRRRAATLHTMIARLTRMTGDLLDLSRLDARRLTIERRPFEVVACVHDAVERIAPEAPDRRFEVEVTGTVPAVLGDADRLAQVVENLLTNAVKYGEPGTPVRIAIAAAEDGARPEVVVAVINQGAPIPPADLARVFQRFERAGIAAHRGVPGIGLGLQIAQALVEAHGGRLTADSGPDRPTTFRFTLPVPPQPVVAEPASAMSTTSADRDDVREGAG